MKRTLYLHIGAHKTGSTAIQNFLNINYDILLKKGILYPRCFRSQELFGNSKQSWSTFAHHNLAWHFIQSRNLFPANYNFESELIREIDNHKLSEIIISSEVFEEEKTEIQEKLKKIKQTFSQFKISIIYYLRRQDNYICSAYKSALCTHRYNPTIDNFVNEFTEGNKSPLSYNMDFYKKISCFAEIFGKENILVKVYEKEQMPNGIFADFLEIFNIELTDEFLLPKKEVSNIGFNEDILEIIRLCNLSFDKTQHRLLIKILNNYLKNSTNKRELFKRYNLISQKQRIRILKKFEKSNRKTAVEYLGRKDGKLFYESMPNENECYDVYDGLTIEKIVSIFMMLLLKQNQKIQNLKKRLNNQSMRINNREK